MTENKLKYKPNLRKRIFATILDYGIFTLMMIAYLFYFGESDGEGGMQVEGLRALPILIVWLVYFVLIEGLYGATLGHQAFYLEVVTLKRRPINLQHALQRHLLDFIDIFLYGIVAIITIKNTQYHQRLGDLWAKTVVIDLDDDDQYEDLV